MRLAWCSSGSLELRRKSNLCPLYSVRISRKATVHIRTLHRAGYAYGPLQRHRRTLNALRATKESDVAENTRMLRVAL